MSRRVSIEKLERRRLFAGVTLLVPAWNGGITGWIATQAQDITNQLGGPTQVPEYILTVAPTSTNGPLAASISHVAGTATPQSGDSGEIMLVLDYDSVATNAAYPLSNVAAVATQFMETQSVDGIVLSQLPLHEISISRGTGEEDEVAKALGASGIWVNQETYLDPHVVPSIGDAANTVYSNVEFSDEYYRVSGDANPVSPEVNSYPVAGAYISNVQSVQDDYGGYAFAHIAVAGYYTGTIDPGTTVGGDGPVNADWYGDGYPLATQTGFYYSAIDGGTRPLSGEWAASGGTGVRTPISTSGVQWPNVSDVTSNAGARIPVGSTLNVHYIQQDASNSATITFYLDSDPNPYNSNFAYTLGTQQVSASGKILSGTFSAPTAGMASGTYYICAKIDDGQGHVRYAYSQAVTLTQPGSAVVQLTGTPIGTAGSYGNDGTTIANAFDGNTSTYFDGPTADGNWAGLDLGTAQNLSEISYAPRAGFENRMIGGIFQASNDPTFTTGVVNLYTIAASPADGYTTISVTTGGTYRYVRYLSPSGSYGDIAEMQVFGYTAGGTDTQPPTQPGTPSLTAPASNNGVSLTWTASTDNVGVDHYNVFRNGTEIGQTLTNSFDDLTALASTAYNYTVDAIDSSGNTSALSSPLGVATATQMTQLTGTLITSTAGSYLNDGEVAANVFDGNLNTYFDAPDASGDWVGLNLGTPCYINRVVYAPRESSNGSFAYETRMPGGIFQASNDPTFTTGVVTLATIGNTPLDGWSGLEVTTPGAYQYVRYVGPAGAYCNVADLQFLGVPANAAVPVLDTTPPSGSVTSAATLTSPGSAAYSFTVTWTDNVSVNAATLGNSNLIVTGPLGYSQTATLTSTGLTSGATVAATYSVPAPAGGWVNADNGGYTIMLQPNQVADTSGNFAAAGNIGTFNVNVPVAPVGSLTGQQVSAASSYNLTTLGTLDWAHWGRNGTYGNFDHKAAGNSQISNVKVVGTGANSGGYFQNSRDSIWSDGTPTSTDTGDTGYIWSNGSLNTGFSFTVPASTTTQTLYVYAGGYGTSSSLTAHLSDGSAVDYTATASGSGLYTNFYTINFKAGSAGQTLTVTLLKTGNITGTGGSVDLISAALAGPDTIAPKAALTSSPSITATSTAAYSFTVTYTDNVAVNAATLGNSNLIVTGPNGYSQAATLTSTGLTNGSTVVATYTVPAPAGGWTNAANGAYTIALQANQVSDTSSNFAAAGSLGTFNVNIPLPGAGSLSGQQVTAASSYNLTTLGTEDWAHWGRGGTYGNFDHKATGNSQISNVTVVGTGANSGGYYQPSRSSIWTDGTPTKANTGDDGYIWSNGSLNTGFSFTVPASTTAQTLYIYAGGYGTSSSLTAHLSDGSAADYVATASGSGLYTNFYTINFKAASAGQTLTITLLKTGNITGTGGSVDLIGAALA